MGQILEQAPAALGHLVALGASLTRDFIPEGTRKLRGGCAFGALEHPRIGRDAFDQVCLDGVAGRHPVVKLPSVGFEFGRVHAGEHAGFRRHAVLERVKAASGLAGVGSGAGASPGILTIALGAGEFGS
jgi:hypothetical protein